jgi:hypothetical protein
MRVFTKMMSQMTEVAKTEADKRSVAQMQQIQSMIAKEVGKKPTTGPTTTVQATIQSEDTKLAKETAAAGMAIHHPMAYLTGDAPHNRKDRDQGNLSEKFKFITFPTFL